MTKKRRFTLNMNKYAYAHYPRHLNGTERMKKKCEKNRYSQ